MCERRPSGGQIFIRLVGSPDSNHSVPLPRDNGLSVLVCLSFQSSGGARPTLLTTHNTPTACKCQANRGLPGGPAPREALRLGDTVGSQLDQARVNSEQVASAIQHASKSTPLTPEAATVPEAPMMTVGLAHLTELPRQAPTPLRLTTAT